MQFDKLTRDSLILTGLELDLPEIINFCKSDVRLDQIICKNDSFWMNKLIKDYPQTYKKLSEMDKKNFRKYYERAYNITNGNYNSSKIYTSKSLTDEIMKQYTANPPGLLPNDMNGWTLRKDKNNSKMAYLYPGSYYKIFGNQRPKEGENHPTIMLKFTVSELKIEEIPWDESVLGEVLHYRRGDGKVSWFDDLYEVKIEYDGGGRYLVFNVYLVSPK